jgi:hypothetical protein
MPDPTPKKKVIVKVPKKFMGKETKSEEKAEGYVPKGLSKNDISKIDETTKFNAKAIATEGRAKGDSIAGANKAKFQGLDAIDQKRAGNAAANLTRVKEGNPQVLRGRTMTADSNYTDKYAPDGYKPSVDSYSRNKPLEKEMPRIGSKGITLTAEKKDSDKKKA